MRACVIGPAPPLRGGIAKHTAGLAEALAARGHDVRVISYSRLYARALFPGRNAHDGAEHVGEALLDTLDPGTWLRVRTELRAWRPDLVVAEWWHPCAAPALATVLAGAMGRRARSPARVAVVFHNARPHEAFPFSRLAARSILRTADAAVCHSRFVAGEVRKLAPELDCRTVGMPLLLAPGTNDDGFSSALPDAQLERRSRGRVPTVLFAGLVRAYKGVDVMLDAWRRARLPAHSRLVIAGESYLGAGRLGQLLERSGPSVHVMGRWLADAELWALLSASDVLVLPYLRASQSGIVPIAVRSGIRIVASNAGGLAEALDVASGRHLAVQVGDSAALAAALERSLEALDLTDAPRQGATLDQGSVERSWAATALACERIASVV